MEHPNILIWQWGRFGSGPRYAYELARGLRSFSDKSVFLSLSQQSEIYQSSKVQSETDLPVRTFSTNRKLEIVKRTMGLPAILKQLDAYLCRAKPDVAICAMSGFWDLIITNHFIKRNVPVISIVHDARCHPGDWFKPLYWLQERQIIRSAGIVTLTKFIAEDLDSKGLLAKVAHSTIPHIPYLFSDLGPLSPSVTDYPTRPTLRLLLAGRMQAYKGLNLFLDALEQLSGRVVKVRICGTGSDPLLGNLVKTNIIDLHKGWLSESDLIEHIDWADVVIAPYIEASQSGIVSVALDRGRPVIVTPVGGLVEQVRHEETGLIIDSLSPERLASAISRFIDEPELYRHCAQMAASSALKRAKWDKIAGQYFELISRVINNRKSN